ncbi:ORF067R [Infectious spleen and kidney necrosis virus]|uniref:ORF067R n=1 Tax=Infectious spleen and kidney necrosis virus (isolate Mandarin fish/China/Nanhai/1998) TaxID=654923 RepID=Q8QUP3_ISKNN|nr:ORF067R [Infectious spleen and kidney necrosis virus]AAL98791.1 ORF067R [Infectious spleen and kidney necrosis virus]WHE27056.1 hypothetical protein [Infectious spleen and kidney necrosis virus]WNH14634.1 hypothetical protein [Infectious spleen and kidney necrosis virus]
MSINPPPDHCTIFKYCVYTVCCFQCNKDNRHITLYTCLLAVHPHANDGGHECRRRQSTHSSHHNQHRKHTLALHHRRVYGRCVIHAVHPHGNDDGHKCRRRQSNECTYSSHHNQHHIHRKHNHSRDVLWQWLDRRRHAWHHVQLCRTLHIAFPHWGRKMAYVGPIPVARQRKVQHQGVIREHCHVHRGAHKVTHSVILI